MKIELRSLLSCFWISPVTNCGLFKTGKISDKELEGRRQRTICDALSHPSVP